MIVLNIIDLDLIIYVVSISVLMAITPVTQFNYRNPRWVICDVMFFTVTQIPTTTGAMEEVHSGERERRG